MRSLSTLSTLLLGLAVVFWTTPAHATLARRSTPRVGAPGGSLMMKSVLMTGIALALVTAAPVDASEHDGLHCEAAVGQRLDRLNVDPSDIRKIEYIPTYKKAGGDNIVIGYEAWVSLHSCQGNLIIAMDQYCRLHQVYGRGACDLQGAVDTW